MTSNELLAQAGDIEDLTVRLLKKRILEYQQEDDMDELFYVVGGVLFRAVQISLAAFAVAKDTTTAKQLLKPVKEAIEVNASYFGDLEYSQETAKLTAMMKAHEPSIMSIITRRRK